MTELKYEYLFNKDNVIIHRSKASKNESYKMYRDELLEYGFKEAYQRKDGVDVRGHYFYKGKNPMYGGRGGESPEHYNAKMEIVNNKSYHDTIFDKTIEFDEVIPEKFVCGNKKPDLLCYVDNKLSCIIEIYYTNRKTDQDIEKLKLSKVPVIEIDINNENECRHLILPALLEANKPKYSILLEEYKKSKQEERRIKTRFSREEIEIEEESEKSKKNRCEEIYSKFKTRADDLRGEIKSLQDESSKLHESIETEIGECKRKYRVLRDSIANIRKNLSSSILSSERETEAINSEIKSLNVQELQEKIATERDTLTKLKFAHSISPIENPLKIRATKKLIARLNTELRAKELNK